jgi:hypothetical protein
MQQLTLNSVESAVQSANQFQSAVRIMYAQMLPVYLECIKLQEISLVALFVNLMTDVTMSAVHNQTAEEKLGSPEEESAAHSVFNVTIDQMEESSVTAMMMKFAERVTPGEKTVLLMSHNHLEEKWSSQ